MLNTWRFSTVRRIKGIGEIKNDFWASPLASGPTNNIISKCFLAKFLLDEQIYLRDISSIPSGAVISFDHTFKVASNIGYLRKDGKRISQYDSLLMNGEGQVLTWQLTKGTAFAEIKTLLTNLRERCPSIKIVYTDECCKLRK